VEAFEKKKRGWRAFGCPECRCVFRLEVTEKTAGTICPSCSFLLQLPGRKGVQGADFSSSNLRLQRQESHSHAATLIHREQRDPEVRWSDDEEIEVEPSWLSPVLIIGMLAFLGIAGAGFFLLKREAAREAKLIGIKGSDSELVSNAGHAGDGRPSKTQAVVLEGSVFDEAAVLNKAEKILSKFFAAKSVDELVQLVRPTLNLEENIKHYYANRNDSLGSDELRKVNIEGEPSFDGKFVSLKIRTEKYDSRLIIFEMVRGELLVDWESWVDWSSMPWTNFLQKRPTEAQEFRVILKESSYYNFEFSDEEKWRSFAMISADKEHQVYAYVERGTFLESQLRYSETGVPAHFLTVTIRFLKDSLSTNQVLIDKVIGEGWVGFQ